MYYKWKKVIFPDEKSKVSHYVSPVIEIISSATFKDFDECLCASKQHNLDLPDSYGGPFLQVISHYDRETLDDIYKYHKNGDIYNMYKAYANVHMDDNDKMHLPGGASQTCKLMDHLDDVKLKVLQEENSDPIKPNKDFNRWSLEPRYRPKWMERGNLCWHQCLSDDIELAVDYSLNRGHPKLYIHKGKRGIYESI